MPQAPKGGDTVDLAEEDISLKPSLFLKNPYKTGERKAKRTWSRN
jgi:hypothetical protein